MASTAEERVRVLEEAQKTLEDAELVTARLLQQTDRVALQTVEAIAQHDAELAAQKLRNKEVDARIDKLVSAIGALIERMPPTVR